MAGISGQFFKQFALTIAASTIISAFNSLTLSPALCAHPAQAARPRRTDTATRTPRPCRGWASSLIGGLIAMLFLAGLVGHLFGIERAGGHGEASHGSQPAPRRCGRSAPALFAVGAVAGWFVSRARQPRLSATFFQRLQLGLRPHDRRLRRGRRAVPAAQRRSCCWSTAACSC